MCTENAEPLIHRRDEAARDVIAWVAEEIKKKGAARG
jgi:hypothetical protein